MGRPKNEKAVFRDNYEMNGRKGEKGLNWRETAEVQSTESGS